MLWGNTAYCVKSSGEGVSRYWNKLQEEEEEEEVY